MTVYSYIYIFLSFILIIYTIRHRLDMLCVASVCYIVYTIYCIPGIGISGFYRPTLSSSLYFAVYTQLIIISLFIVLQRHKQAGFECVKPVKREGDINNSAVKYSFRIYTIIIALFTILNILSIGLHGLSIGKAYVWENTNVLYLISLYGAWPAFAYGLHKDDEFVWITSLIIEITIFFAGSRAFMATMIIIFLCEKGTTLWKERKGNFHLYILGGLGVVFILIYRAIDQAIMKGNFNLALTTLRNPLTWATVLEFNEPRVIIANYDYSFTSGIHLPLADIIYRIIDFIPGLTALFKIDLSYPEYYSTWIQEQVHGSSGVGGSIWGESYAMFGFFGIVIFTLLWLKFISMCNEHLDYHSNVSYFLVSIGIYWAWYINRLDFNRVGQSCKVMTLCFLIWSIPYLVMGGTIKIGKIKFCLSRKSINNRVSLE